MSIDPATDELQRWLQRLTGQRYELLRRVGRGGMASVYAARDHRLQRTVAIKALHHHLLANDEHCTRFRREAEAIARLDHPGIIQIFDLVEERGEFLAIIMAFVDGPSLADVAADKTPMLPEIACALALPIAQSLAIAHDARIIHRDLKPANILITAEGQPVLTDFGIAHVADGATLTSTGNLLGSPAYMAPEIIDGQPATPAADIFSLGAILHLLVTGQPAFSGTIAPEVLRNISTDKRRPAHRVHPAAGHRTTDLIDTMLATAPADRPASATQVVARLGEFLDYSLGDDRPDLKRWFSKPSETTLDLQSKVLISLIDKAAINSTTGDTGQAFDLLERALAIAPDNAEAQQLLDEIHRHRDRSKWRPAAGVFAAAAVATALWLAFNNHRDVPPTPSATESTDAATAAIASTNYAFDQAHTAAEAAARATGVSQMTRSLVDETTAADLPPSPSPLPSDAPALDDQKGAQEQPPDAGDTTADTTADAPLRLRFRLVPTSASLTIDGREYDALQAAQGIDLAPGTHTLRAQGPGTEPLEKTIEINADDRDERRLVLTWAEAQIRLVTDRDALVWVGDNRTPQTVDAGADTTFSIPFGPANTVGTSQQVELRIADRQDLQNSRRRTVELRPAQKVPLAITLGGD